MGRNDEKVRNICLAFTMGLGTDLNKASCADDAGRSASTEEAVALIEGRFRDFLDTSADWLWETDLDQRFTYYSGGGLPEFGQPVGISRHELMRRMKVDPPDLPDTIGEYMKRGEPFRDLEYRMDRPDGSSQWVRLSGKPVHDPEGRLLGYRGSARNITSIREAAIQLAERQARYESIFANAVEGIYRTALDGTYLETNPALARMHGYDTVEEFRRANKRSVRLYVDERDRERLVRLALKQGYVRGFECYALRRDGSRFLMSETCWPVYHRDGRVVGFEGLIEDITERKRGEQALEQARNQALEASRAKSDFLAHISHELRTPLNAVIGYSDAMASEIFGPLGSERYREYCQHIRDSGMHLLSLITNILDLSKVEAGQLVMRSETCDLVELAQSAMRLVERLSYEQGVRVSFSPPETSLPFRGDARAIKQILVNLLSNALKFTQPPGRVTLHLEVQGESTRLRVVDEGIGMTEEEVKVALLFFRQVENPLNRRVEGSGLGLSLVKALAEAHGGTLTIHSRPGVGTSAEVCLPPLSTKEQSHEPS